MTINSPKLEKTSNNIRINFDIESENFEKKLWYEVDKKYKDFLSDSCDSALIALLLPAMYKNEDIHINGTVSEKLLFNFHRLQKILQILVPSLHIINVTYKETTTFSYDAKYVATGFSGGIDSYTTLDDYFYNCNLENHKITHLTYHNVGNHIIGDYNTDFNLQKELFDKRFDKINTIASKLGKSGIPFIKVDSNLDLFYIPEDLNYEQTYTLRNLSVALLLQKGLKIFYSSSGYSYEYVEIKKYSTTTKIDPILLPLFATKSLDTILVGAEYTRVEKTLKVAKLKDAQISLDVCTDSDDGTNCSKCYKCLRTQLTLDLAGKLNEFSTVFDLEVYEQHKKEYIKKVILNITPPYSSEILTYARELDENYGTIDVNALINASEGANKFTDEQFNANAIYKKAIYYQHHKDISSAIRLYKLALSLDPHHAAANHYLELLEQLYRV